MIISEISIHNYRSIQDMTIQLGQMTVLLGPNNHGKSNVLRALEFALSSTKPTSNDFCRLPGADDGPIWADLTFIHLTEQEKTTFSKYVQPDGPVKFRKSATVGEDGKVDVKLQGYVWQPNDWWLQESAADRLGDKEQVKGLLLEIPELERLLTSAGKAASISKTKITEFQESYISEHQDELQYCRGLSTTNLLGGRGGSVGGGTLPEYFLLPAICDLSDEVKCKSTTFFGRLLQRAIQEMVIDNPSLTALNDSLRELIAQLNGDSATGDGRPTQLAEMERLIAEDLRQWGVTVSIEVTPPDLERVFELGTQLSLDDGVSTLAEDKGHGLQRAVIFALIRAWGRRLRTARTSTDDVATVPRAASASVVFAIEEPELFLHPHGQRRLAESLREIAEAPNHQVIVCTHSTHFIDLDHYNEVVIISKPGPTSSSSVRQCSQELFGGPDAKDRKDRFHMASWVNPDRAELFFAREVALVEGETEKALLSFIARRMGCYDSDVSIIDCGSKHNIPLYIELLNAFAIEYVVVHDEDPLPDPIPSDWSKDKRESKQRTYDMNTAIEDAVDECLGKVLLLQPDLETALGVSKSQGEKKGKALAALDTFRDTPISELPSRLHDVIIGVYGVPQRVEIPR